MFVKTPKQVEATKLQTTHIHTMLYGGSRSGKTAINIRNIALRALKVPSRHLILRKRFNHVKTSIWYDTFPKVMKLAFPGVPYHPNKSDWFFEFENGSQIWLGGLDDKERAEKILGNEYSTIYPNECSEMSYDSIQIAQTRLAENTALTNRMFYDMNPPTKKHWSYKLFIEGKDPESGEPINNSLHSALLMNPADNKENLPDGYIEQILGGLSKRKRERFLHGMFLSAIEGALWTDEMINEALYDVLFLEPIETVVAVDPAVSNTDTSDEHGIVVCSRDIQNHGLVEADYSLKGSPEQWGQTAVNAYHKHNANYIVAEVNQGGDLVENCIKQIDSSVPVRKVRASKGKFARAEPVQLLYEQSRIKHNEGLDELETQMTEWVPIQTKESPDRIDALVWGFTELLINQDIIVAVAPTGMTKESAWNMTM